MEASNEMPKVLIIGDSISIGYLPFVQEMMKGEALVTRPFDANGEPENCQGTTNGKLYIDKWIGKERWDIIHFNFGLHDIKHVKADTGKNSNDPNDPQQADVVQYEKNLAGIVSTLKATKAKLVFATTTPYPDTVSKPLRTPGMPEKYNKAALAIMKRKGISVNDLYDFVASQMVALQRPDNVHFTETGYEALADEVVKAIRAVLPAE
ncbi:MAG: lysophospholipase L1-like esterase [Candidatus Pelagisphaera sp.]|jgi:lysophospholipase L1-like esterase